MARHLAYLDSKITPLIWKGNARILVTMPPRHGKSVWGSQYLPAWYLGMRPDHGVILTGYGGSFANKWGRATRNTLEEYGAECFGVEVAGDSRAADQWSIKGTDGGMYAVGVGGPITGRGGNVVLVDDPIKNADEANSQTYRDKIWDWWTSTLYTRLEPGGSVIVTHTRWNEDDLIGRIKRDSENSGEQWTEINFPAIAEEHDELGRKPGEALWPERFDVDRLAVIRRTLGEYYWSALYQQRPTVRTGGLFKIDNVQQLTELPRNLRECRAWDLAATENDGDWTAGVKIGTDGERYFILDVVRGRWATDMRDRIIRETAERDGRECRIRLPQDPGQAGKSQAVHFARLLAGFRFRILPVTGDKETRADGWSSQVNAGNVYADKTAPWWRAFCEEYRAFKNGCKQDDQADAGSDAFNDLVGPAVRVLVA